MSCPPLQVESVVALYTYWVQDTRFNLNRIWYEHLHTKNQCNIVYTALVVGIPTMDMI